MKCPLQPSLPTHTAATAGQHSLEGWFRETGLMDGDIDVLIGESNICITNWCCLCIREKIATRLYCMLYNCE